jgi:hypothetical protein
MSGPTSSVTATLPPGICTFGFIEKQNGLQQKNAPGDGRTNEASGKGR